MKPLPDNPYPDALIAIRGYRERLTPGTRFKVIEIDFTADPAKDSQAWLDEQYRLMGESKVRREVLRDWTVAAGDAFYPEYANYGGRTRYEFRVTGLLRGTPVVVGWDLGIRRPVFVFLQISPTTRRVYVIRAVCNLRDVDTYTLADFFNLLVGKLTEDELLPSALELYQSLVLNGLPKAPWFPPETQFHHIAGPEGRGRTANARPDDPRTTIDILGSKGIHLEAPRVLVVDRVKVLRKLLLVRRGGRPSIFISDDPTCDEIHNMLNGGLSFPKGTIDNPTPVKPRKDGWYDDIHDALTYPIAELIPAEEIPEVTRREVWGGAHSREPRTVVEGDDGEFSDLGFYETRGR